MNCNCNNKNEILPDVRIVQGNVLRLAIPLTLRTLEKVGDEIQATDTDFIPTNNVKIALSKMTKEYKFTPTIEGHVAYIEDEGTLPIGIYSITIITKDGNGKPLRYKDRGCVGVYDTAAEAGITPGIEFEAGTQWLDAAVFLAFGGGGGIGEETDPIFSASPAAGITQAIIDYWNAKQEAIIDLGQIRAGAAAGATALQPGALDGYATSDAVNRAIARIQSSIDELMGADDVTVAINTFREIVAFLDSVENTETLAGIIAGLNTAIAAKYTKPGTGIPASDLAQAVRDLLALAGTAVQPSTLNGYVTTSTLEGYYTKSEVNNLIPDISGKANKSEMAVADNNNGTVTITLKTGTSATVLTQHQSLAGYALSSSLAAVATSGSYNDLSNKPTIPAAQVQSDWNAVSGMGVILNKPTNLSEFTNDLETPSVTVTATGDVSQALNPNTFYRFGAVDSLDLTLVAGTGLVVYFGRFSTSANWGGTGLTVPSGVTEGANNPTVEASKTYEFNIMDNVLLLMEV